MIRRRAGAEFVCWATVHGLAMLLLDGPYIADAFARAAAAFGECGARSVPAPVRLLVRDCPSAPTGLSARDWLAAATRPLPSVDRPAGRLALLTAVASYRVTREHVDDYRAAGHDDARLVELIAWASFAAARRIGAALAAREPLSPASPTFDAP